MKNKLTRNFGLKILAIIFSFGLWLSVVNISDPVISVTFSGIGVEMKNESLITNEGKVYEILDDSDIVSVEVTGKRSVIDSLNKEDIRAVADMADLSFMNTVGIKVSSTKNNSQLEYRCSSENVKLEIEDVKKIQMVINTRTTGEPAKGYIVGNVTPSQNLVRISGPESVVNKIKQVEAEVEIDSSYASDINTSVELRLYDEDHVQIKNSSIKQNITTINVAVTVLATKEVPLNFAVSGTPAEGYMITGEILSIPETVTIAGKRAHLDAINEISITDPALNITGQSSDMTTIIDIKKYLPTGTQFADSAYGGSISVTVKIVPQLTKEFAVPAKNIAVANPPGNLELTIKELGGDVKTYPVVVTGIADTVEGMKAEDIIGVVDMDTLLQELDMDAWKAGEYKGDIIFNLPEEVSLKETYQLTLVLEEETQEEE